MVKNRKTWLVAAALVLGTSVSAQASTNEALEIRAMTDHLNYWFPGLSLTIKTEPQDLRQVLNDLQKLEDSLHGGPEPQPGELTTVDCTKPSCGN